MYEQGLATTSLRFLLLHHEWGHLRVAPFSCSGYSVMTDTISLTG